MPWLVSTCKCLPRARKLAGTDCKVRADHKRLVDLRYMATSTFENSLLLCRRVEALRGAAGYSKLLLMLRGELGRSRSVIANA